MSNFPILQVTDQDSGRNAKVLLKIVAGNRDEQFRIDPLSGMLYVARPLDAEYKTRYTLTVSALDQANAGMRKQSSARVRIFVDDVNDNDPKFGEDEKTIYFDENESAGTRVMRVNAKDQDSGENAHISYSIANFNAEEIPFDIDHFTGIIKSKRLVDYESDKREYKLQIRASDWGTPFRRQTELKLTIRIKDINDNRPQVTIWNNQPTGLSTDYPLSMNANDFSSKQFAAAYNMITIYCTCFYHDQPRWIYERGIISCLNL
jgi:protocadherin Fat 1/2/3